MKRKVSRISIKLVKLCVSEVVDFWWWLFYFACRKRGYAERGVMPKEGLWMVLLRGYALPRYLVGSLLRSTVHHLCPWMLPWSLWVNPNICIESITIPSPTNVLFPP